MASGSPGRHPDQLPPAGKAETLIYAPAGALRRHRYRLLIRTAAIVGICLGVYAILEFCIDFGQGYDYCPLCGADSHVRHFEFLGIGGEFARRVQPGPISQFIQSRTGQPCPHAWRMVSCTSGGVLRRRIEDSFRGACGPQRMFESCPGALKFLEQETARDSSFVRRLQAAVGSDDDWAITFWSDLRDKAWAAVDQPATRSAESAPSV